MSTCHSQIGKWCGNKPRVLVLNRVDMISERDKAAWTRHFNAAGTHVCWTDGVSGYGTGQVGLDTLTQHTVEPETSMLGTDELEMISKRDKAA